ncbi:MAG TPA: hypothetical protein VGP32_07780 [Steroidobacteraceae bacterium]|jgi:hypothetical protein|nr:hypothetical protein [Steroidobacteraceae bacterium]
MKERLHALIEKRLRNRRKELLVSLRSVEWGARPEAHPQCPERAAQSMELNEVESALRRLQDRTYGICRECGAPIAHARLYSEPHIDRCGHCAARGLTMAREPANRPGA